MLHYGPAFISLITQSLFNIDTCFGISSLFEQNPRIGIEISFIIWLSLHGTITHLFCLIQILPFHRKKISIIIQCTDIVRIVHQRRIISSICLSMHFLRVIQITQYCVEIRHNTLVTFSFICFTPLVKTSSASSVSPF